MTRTVTINDIAKDSGVSRSTVSLVLQNSSLVADDTRERVKESVKRLGYVYNRAAASLRGSRSGNYGLIVSSIRNPYFAEIVTGVDQQTSGLNKSLILGQHEENPKVQERLMITMIESRVDGVMLVPAYGTSKTWLESLRSKGIQTLFLTRRFSGIDFPYFGADSADAAYLATKHLLSHDVKKIVLVGGRSQSSPFNERKLGVQKALQEQSKPARSAEFHEALPTQEGGYRATLELFKSKPRSIGLLAYNDITATGILAALRSLGMSAGPHLPVVGIDDIESSKYLSPSLSTISNSPREIGRSAAQFLIDSSHQTDVIVERSFIPTNQLVVRASCGCIEQGESR